MEKKEAIISGKTALGIELGSTRIKGVLIDFQGQVLAVGIHDWENSLVNNIWTYSLEDIHTGVRNCYTSLRETVKEKYGVVLETVGAIGVSAMMHGYMALDKDGNQIAPFQTELKENEVMIQVKYCGVCGTDMHIFNGDGGSFEVNPR